MNLKIQLVKTKKEYKDILEIRKKVFVEEQNVPLNIEIEHEEDSKHVICFIDQLAVGTGRWRKTKNGIKLERFAVLTDFPCEYGSKHTKQKSSLLYLNL